MKILNMRLRNINLSRCHIVSQITKVVSLKNQCINIHIYPTKVNTSLTNINTHWSKKQRSLNQESNQQRVLERIYLE
jgi:hypothetical protein